MPHRLHRLISSLLGFCGLLLGWLAAGPALADQQSFETGFEAFAKQRYKTAAVAWEGDPADPLGQYYLGTLLHDGRGRPRDPEGAARALRFAAEAGLARAQYLLGTLYERGFGVAKERAEARRWYLAAAEQGHPTALYRLGVYAQGGLGEPKDAMSAYAWFSLAEDAGADYARQFRRALRQVLLDAEIQAAELRAKSFRAQHPTPTPAMVEESERLLALVGLFGDRPDGTADAATELAIGRFRAAFAPALEDDALTWPLVQALERAAIADLGRRAETAAIPGSHGLPRKPDEADEATAPPPAGSRPSGSGVFVSRLGHVLTAAHVAGACRNLIGSLGGQRLELEPIAIARKSDLALLHARRRPPAYVRLAPDESVEAGLQVLIVGFPLRGILTSEPQLASGHIGALAGPRDDRTRIQITAPVQPGSSGAPLLDASGRLVGMVSSRLGATRVAELTGQRPENVNFAVALPVIARFLTDYGVPAERLAEAAPKSLPEVFRAASGFALAIDCADAKDAASAD